MIFFSSVFSTEHLSHLTEHSLENIASDCLLRHSVMFRIFKFLIVVNVKYFWQVTSCGLEGKAVRPSYFKG